jgi:5'-deoxynucleotidase
MKTPSIFTAKSKPKTQNIERQLTVVEIEAQVMALLAGVSVSDKESAKNLVEYVHLSDTIKVWPQSDVFIIAYSGRNEGMHISIECRKDGQLIGQLISIKLFCSQEIAWRLAMLLDSAFEQGAYGLWDGTTVKTSQFCTLSNNGNIHYMRPVPLYVPNAKPSEFVGIMARARNIHRWPLMFSVQNELLCEHIYQTAYVGHLLGAIAADIFGEDINPDKVASLGIFHEVSELYTNDMPTSCKYKSEAIAKMVKDLEHEYEVIALNSLPEAIRARYQPYIIQNKSDNHAALSKAADVICAYMKCEFELMKGNTEFEVAKSQSDRVLTAFRRKYPCVDYFCKTFLPSANATIDTQMQGDDWTKNVINSHI